MWRRLIILLAVLLGMVTGAAVALKSERVANHLRQRLEQLAAERLGHELEIDTLAVELWPPRLHVAAVRLSAPGAAAPMLTLARGSVRIHPWPAASGAIVVDELALDGLHGRLDLDALGLGAPKPGSGDLRLPLDLHALALRDVRFVVRSRGWEIAVRQADLAIEPARGGGRVLTLRQGEAVVERGARRVEVRASLSATLAGSVDRPEELALSHAELVVDGVALTAAGKVRLARPQAVDLALNGEVPLARLTPLLTDLPRVEGASRFTLRLRGPLTRPEVGAEVAVKGLEVGGTLVGDVEVAGRLLGSRARIESLSIVHPRAGKVTGSGVLALTPALEVEGKLRLHEVSLPETLAVAGLEDAWVDARVSGDLAVDGALAPFDLHALASLAVDEFRVRDRSYRAAGGAEILHLGPVKLDGRVALGPRAVVIDDATVTRGSSVGRVQATLHFDLARGMELSMVSDFLDLAELGPIATVPFLGKGSVAATIEGRYQDPTISATASIERLNVLGYAIGDTRATIIYDDFVLRLDRASGRRGGGTFAGDGAIDFHGPAFSVAARAQLDGVSLADLMLSGPRRPAVFRRLHARASGVLRASGPLVTPELTAELTAPALAVDATELGALRLSARYSGPTDYSEVQAETKSANGSMAMALGAYGDGRFEVDAAVDDVALEVVKPLFGGVDLHGRATGSLQLAGGDAELSGRVEASSPALTTFGAALGATTLMGEISGDDLALSGSTVGGGAQVQASVTLSGEMPFTATSRFDELAIAALWPDLASFGAAATGSLFAQGQLADPESILADITLDAAHLTLLGVAVSSARPARLQYATGTVHLVDLALLGPGLRASVRGTASPDGPLSLAVDGTAELDVARPSVWRLTGQRGRVALGVRVTGSWREPYFDGEATLEEGFFRVRDTGQVVDAASGRVVFSGRSISVVGASARTGGGEISLVGQVTLPFAGAPELDLHAEVDDVTLRPSSDLTATIQGSLRLAGEPEDLQLSGDIDIESLRYAANLDLERLVPRRNAPPLRVPSLTSERPLRLSVRLSATNDVLVTSPVIEAELQADLVMTGTTDRIGLVGSMTPLWARARYQDNVFSVERASILFTDEYRVFTEFDLRARTQACGLAITVDIQGNSDGYNVVPSGADETGPASPQDVLTCLQLGLRLRDLRGPEGALLSDRLTTSGLDALWAVSGLDQQVRRILPMVDELRLASGWSQRSKRTTPRIVVGKELGGDLQLTYSRALDVDYDQVFSVEYRVNELATMQGTWNTGTDAQLGDFGLDLRLRWEFQ